MQRACSEGFVPHDDRLHRLRRDVVIRGEFESEALDVAKLEGFRDALLVGSALFGSVW